MRYWAYPPLRAWIGTQTHGRLCSEAARGAVFNIFSVGVSQSSLYFTTQLGYVVFLLHRELEDLKNHMEYVAIHTFNLESTGLKYVTRWTQVSPGDIGKHLLTWYPRPAPPHPALSCPATPRVCTSPTRFGDRTSHTGVYI